MPTAVPRAVGTEASDLGLLRQHQRIICLDPKIPHSAFQLGVPEQQLTGTQVAGALVDHSDLRLTQAIGIIVGWIKADHGDPVIEEARVLPRCQVPVCIAAAGEEPITISGNLYMHPVRDGIAGWFCQFKWDWPTCLLLDHSGPRSDGQPGERSTSGMS